MLVLYDADLYDKADGTVIADLEDFISHKFEYSWKDDKWSELEYYEQYGIDNSPTKAGWFTVANEVGIDTDDCSVIGVTDLKSDYDAGYFYGDNKYLDGFDYYHAYYD